MWYSRKSGEWAERSIGRMGEEIVTMVLHTDKFVCCLQTAKSD